MEVVNSCEGRYERRESLPNSTDDNSSSSSFDSSPSEEETQSIATDNTDLKQDLQKSVAGYKTDSNIPSQTGSTNDDEFQAAALCQFMDILNDLDDVLDKSLLACLDDPKAFDSDEEDLICKTRDYSSLAGPSHSSELVSLNDDTQVICENDYYFKPKPSAPPLSLEYDITTNNERSDENITNNQDASQTAITSTQEIENITNEQIRCPENFTTDQERSRANITNIHNASHTNITTDQVRYQGNNVNNSCNQNTEDNSTDYQDRIQENVVTNDQNASETNITDDQIRSQETITNIPERSLLTLGRSKSFSDLTTIHKQTLNPPLELASMSTTNDTLRNSMQRLDPIVLPTISSEPLTLPVILFLEHHVNMRPSTSPIQVQVTAANLSASGSSGPLIVGRRALLTVADRALSLPSPVDSELTEEWTGRHTARSTGRSSSSSSSSESLAGVLPMNQNNASADESVEEAEDPPFGVWPHRMSAMLACLSCTVGLFNISRFATFSVHFGASFIVQFFILSFLIGIPLFTLYLCLGQVLESGPVDMWRISPIFQGVGISMLITQAVIGMYSIIGLSWIFVYFRDSFISMDDRYKWALPCEIGTEDGSKNITYKIQETLPQYFHSEVLQRNYGSNGTFGTIKFQVAFNLAVVWMIVFVALSKGLRSYGKAVYMLIFLPICGTLVLCTKLLTLIPYDSVTNIFSETEWSEFFINSNSWAAATQETFLTWGLLGACIMQLTSHKSAKNKTNVMLQKESACIVSFTFAVLLLSSFLANTCVQILKNHGYYYIPGSYETLKSSQFLWPVSEPLPGSQASTPVRYMAHYGGLVGVTVWRGGGSAKAASGWQPLQLATQLVPATLAVLPNNVLSPAWAVIFYFILITFGLAQQLAIWHCVLAGVLATNPRALRVWETTVTFLGCVIGLACSLALTTDAGIKIVHFLDYVWVGSWWHCVVQVALACGVFVVRGRPYSPDVVVAALYSSRSRLSATLAALLSFTWTVILPVLLCAICVMDFRLGQQRQLYNWRKNFGYWPVWARQVGVLLQQMALLSVPLTAFVQTWRYMSKGPPDILERIQNLYRPAMPAAQPPPPRPAPAPRAARPAPAPDPPPKYTPPPSYSTATGARLLNTIRRSFRTLRRITSTRADLSSQAEDPHAPITLSETVDHHSLESQPPQYTSGAFPTFTISDEIDHRQRPSRRISVSLTRDYLRRSFVRKSDSVKSIRSSLRRNFKFGNPRSTSNEQLVRDVEPISNTGTVSAMLDDGLNSTEHPSSVM